MRLLVGAAFLAAVSSAFGQEKSPPTAEEALAAEKSSSEAVGGISLIGPNSTFNGQSVPPIVTFDGSTYKQALSSGYWLAEGYSPYCHHCRSLAPKWQTLYEFYYTSNPTNSPSGPTFTEFYNLRFAKLDCVAFGNACVEMGVKSWPTIILFKDGKEVLRSTGDLSMIKLGTFVEQSLETIRPNSRPLDGISLPKAGVHDFSPESKKSLASTDSKDGHESTNKLETQKTTEIPVVEAPKIPKVSDKVPAQVANTEGQSISLTPDSFSKHVSNTLDPWFVKFYAPWCPHCQHLAPAWSAMAREMKGKLNVGEVDCEAQRSLCSDMHVKGYPTLVYFQGPERREYDGLRGLGDLIQFGNEAVNSAKGVEDVTAAQFDKLEEDEEVIFVYFYDHATTSEDIEALERLPFTLIGHGRIVKSGDTALAKRLGVFTYPRLIVSRGGHAMHFEHLMPQDIRDVKKVRKWMEKVWHPLVPELTATNARQMMDEKYVVLGILNREHWEDFKVAKRELRNAALDWKNRQDEQFRHEREELRDAKKLRIKAAKDRNDARGLEKAKLIHVDMEKIKHKETTFAWIDGVFWQKWIGSTYGLTADDSSDRIIINDYSVGRQCNTLTQNRQYWDTTLTGSPIAPLQTSILETLAQVFAHPSKIAAKSTGSSLDRVFVKSRKTIKTHRLLSGGAFFVSLLLVIEFMRRTRRRRLHVPAYFRLEDKERGLPFAGVNGKSD